MPDDHHHLVSSTAIAVTEPVFTRHEQLALAGFLAPERAAQGIGGAAVWATSLALLGEAFRDRDRGLVFGIYGAVLGGGFALTGTGILPMTGLGPASAWTHLLPGLIVAGLLCQ